jgi:hypothetical protein
MWFAIASSAVLAVLGLRPKLIAAYFSAVGVRDPAVAAMGAVYTRVTALGALPLSAAACASAGFKGIGETNDPGWLGSVGPLRGNAKNNTHRPATTARDGSQTRTNRPRIVSGSRWGSSCEPISPLTIAF